MKTMNKIKNIYILLMLVALGLSSCELKNELEGKYKLKADEGLLDLNLVPKTSANVRAGETAETMDVNKFRVEIVDVSTDAVVRSFESYEKLKAALPIIVPVGSYKIVARSGELQDASRIPYFEGNSTIDVKQGVQSKAEVICKLATVKVALNLSDDFLNAFAEDYSIGITNGQGGIIYFNKDEISSVYLSIPNASVSIKIMAKVTDKETGKDVQTTYTVSKPGNEELTGGDSFNVNIKPTEDDNPDNPDIPVEPSKPHFGLQLDIDLTMDKDGVTIKVPTELIEESKPEEPEEPEAEGPEIIGADAVVEFNENNPEPIVRITMKAPAGIQNLYVTITSESPDFMDTIKPGGLDKTFDLANLSPELADGLSSLGLIDPTQPIKNEKVFVFDISQFMPLLGNFGTAKHYFTIKLVDNNNKSVQKTLTVNVVIPE